MMNQSLIRKSRFRIRANLPRMINTGTFRGGTRDMAPLFNIRVSSPVIFMWVFENSGMIIPAEAALP